MFVQRGEFAPTRRREQIWNCPREISVAPVAEAPESGRVAALPKPILTVQVRELVEFALRRGDLGGERDFVGPSRALAGIRGHQRVQRSRPAEYQREVRLARDLEGGEFVLRVQGRIDGLAETTEDTLIEEIKTVQGGWNGEARALDWAQVKLYGALYAHDHAAEQVELQLTYLDLETDRATEFRQRCSAAALEAVFAEATTLYLDWLRDLHHWRNRRDDSIRALVFPFPAYRTGQRQLAVAAYRALKGGRRLFLEAPTGVGKTISVLFPAIKTLAEGHFARVFYLTARTVGRAVAEKALADLRQAGLRLRSLTLTAREKICFQPGTACDAAVCPFALGYYDRVKPAMRAALAGGEITRLTLEQIGREHQVCPFELSLDVSVWVDAVVCDYNYVFDPKAWLRRHFADEGGPYAFLVDEAHNLVDRAREMFSADLTTREILEVRRALKDALPRCARALSKVSAALRKLHGAEAEELLDGAGGVSGHAPALLDLWPDSEQEPLKVPTESEIPADRLPETLVLALDQALKEAEAWLARNRPAAFRESLLALYFRLHSFRRTADLYDEHYTTLTTRDAGVSVRLFCLDPSHLLRQALARGKAAIFFSATITPPEYYRDLLGGEPGDPQLRLPSPFPPTNLAVLVQDRIRTQFKARGETLEDVAQAIAAVTAARPGNYLVYLPSFQYLAAVHARFRALRPEVRTLAQGPRMTEADREGFLRAFAAEPDRTLLGFAVMGGVFGEGIDLVGDRLIGAVIVGVGLPQICVERDLIRDYFQSRNGAGFDYAYTFPGMNRVLQAIGRVIRSETDRGVVLLIDTRFAETRYRRLFPAWWHPTRTRNLEHIHRLAEEFWGVTPPRTD